MKTTGMNDFYNKYQYYILLAVGAIIIALVIYRTIILPDPDTIDKLAIEGFNSNTTNRTIQDLLDKLTVDLYGKVSVWDNQLFRSQDSVKERPLSIWSPLNETGEMYRLLGHVVGDSEEYKMPRETTMLVQGDTKPPIDATMVFEFPHNQMTKPNKDNSAVVNVYKGIKNLDDLYKRRATLREGLSRVEDTFNRLETDVKNTMANVTNRQLTTKVDLFGPEGYFQAASATVNLDSENRAMSFPNGIYNSMRVPIGSIVTLTSESGGILDVTLPLDLVLDNNGELINNGEGPTVDNFYRYIDGIQPNDFRVTGKFCLRARDYFGANNSNNTLNDRKNSTVNRSNAKDPNKVFMPFFKSQSPMVGQKKDINYNYNYTVSNGIYPIDKNGRSDIYNYLLKDEYIDKSANGIISEGRIGVSKINYKHNDNGSRSELQLENSGSKQMRDALLYRVNEIVNMPSTALNSLLADVTELSKEQWAEDESLFSVKQELDNITKQTTISIDKYYMDMAFTFRTWDKYIKKNFGKLKWGKYDSRGEKADTVEMLYRSGPPNFYGKMSGGAIRMLDDKQQTKQPSFRQMQYISDTISSSRDRLVAIYTRMIASLDSIETLVQQNQFLQFPLRIWRPVPLDGYVSIGDIAINHENMTYDKRRPELGMVACIPKQCVREMRDWLPIDRIYEYRNTDVSTGGYMAIYRNPYMQTFKVSTQPGIVPSGKVEKVVACVERCKVLDDIIEADKCAQEFHKANKRATESYNLDSENVIHNREGHIYRNRIREREDKLNSMREVARRLQIQDDKAHIVNQEYNRQKFQKLVDKQRHNINALADKLDQKSHSVDVNVHFDYDKFQRLLYALRESDRIPTTLHDQLQEIVGNALSRQDAQPVDNETLLQQRNSDLARQILGICPTPESQGLILKSLVESGCYNCANLM